MALNAVCLYTHHSQIYVSVPSLSSKLQPHISVGLFNIPTWISNRHLKHNLAKTGLFFFLSFFNWSIVDLQCCVYFCCIAKWFNYIYVCIYVCLRVYLYIYIYIYIYIKTHIHTHIYTHTHIFWPHHGACRILVPQPGIEPTPSAVKV